MKAGCYTALITPFINNSIDYEGLDKLADFQIKNGITGILAVGTTGESPTLSWEEHNKAIEIIINKSKDNCVSIAGTGSNNTREAIEATKHAARVGVDAVLLVDPYYNGPSSLEIRREYIEPIAAENSDIIIIPYIIPGRTGAQMMPEDLAIVYNKYKNVCAVKEATGNISNMQQTRKCCGPDFNIISGDDALVYDMMTDPLIKASGVISVASNIAPKAMTQMVANLTEGNIIEATKIKEKVEPLFQLVTVSTKENTPYGEVICRARNPLAIKTLMTILGMPSGRCRRPLGKMTENGIQKVIEVLETIYNNSPEILRPIEDYFNVNIKDRLNDKSFIKTLIYPEY
ncbi:MAG: 4-hydroxy-tetrahydrodipicolinate synthase [Proteobacteria bacterium]|nr:4-hydroxy-tetrahydrodipicolinate synthase [Pseudomonadota bacterium]